MDSIIVIALVIVIILIWLYRRGPQPQTESVVNLIYKRVPKEQVATCDAVTIDAIPLSEPSEQYFAEDPPVKPIYSDEKPAIALTFDASVARNALLRSRDKRVFDAIANRTANYWRPFFEEELRQCEQRDWWDDVAYPMNDSGEYVITPEQDPPSYPEGRSM